MRFVCWNCNKKFSLKYQDSFRLELSCYDCKYYINFSKLGSSFLIRFKDKINASLTNEIDKSCNSKSIISYTNSFGRYAAITMQLIDIFGVSKDDLHNKILSYLALS